MSLTMKRIILSNILPPGMHGFHIHENRSCDEKMKDGKADYPVLAPSIKSVSQITGRAIMIHAGGDSHDDHPSTLGGGGQGLPVEL